LKGNAARVIENVAASVADGAKVDWDRADMQVSGRELRLVRHLRLIDSVAEVYRTLPPLAEDDGTGSIARPDYPEGPRWGRLILLDRIGRGASADVFRAWDAELQREVALKLLHDEGTADDKANAHLLREARRLARIRHPNVVHVYGAERHEERIGLWMELVRGRSLDETVRQEGPFAIAEAVHIGVDLCSALGTVHGAGLLHRDVKAQNVVREDSGRIVLTDFGTGQEIEDGTPRLAGTPIYLAPEIIRHGPASVQSDLYGVGVLLFYLITGQFPVTGESLDGLAEAHRAGQLRGVREVRHDVPSGVARVVDRALAPQPSRRYASASAMEAALRQALDAMPGQRKPARSQWWVMTSMAAAIIALVGALFVHRAPARASSADLTSIAVLPLTFGSGEKEAPYLADGLTDQLITTLGQVHSLKVTALTSVRRYRGTDRRVSEIAPQLGVGSVVEGSIAVQPGEAARVRINVRLIRAGDEVEVWSDSFERPLGDLLALEADVARAVARNVRAVLTPEEAAHLDRSQSTTPSAERAYLEGLSYLNQNRHGTEVRPALEAFQQAIGLDPMFAPPHAAAAKAYVRLGFDEEIPQAEAYASAAREARRALELNDRLADAHAALADITFYYGWNWGTAESEYKQAIDLDPSASYARTQYARFLAAATRLDAAQMQADDAVAVDPLSADVLLTAGLVSYYARRYDDAAATLERVVRMDPRFQGGYVTLGRIYEAQGRLDDAINVTDRARRLVDTPPLHVMALRLRALAGKTQQARREFAQLSAQMDREHRQLESSLEALYRLALGETERPLDLLTRAVNDRNPRVLWMKVDPRLDALRSDSRFQTLEAHLGAP
jgi:TolB-like protein/Tfp pilus assembly protein PilF/tRNA A-37 threonylcarbamoyl transferase component Bud32